MYSKGISWIDDCRIPFVDEKDPSKERYKYSSKGSETWGGTFGVFNSDNNETNTQGRFPANLLVSDDMLNDGVISKSGKDAYRRNTKIDGSVNFMGGTEKDMKMLSYNDKGTNSRYYDLDKWFDNLINV